MIQKLTKELVVEANAKKGTPDGKAFGLVGHYQKCYKEKYEKEVYVNLHKYKFMALDVLNGYEDYEKVKKVIEYYFVISKPGHPIEYLLRNFHEIMEAYDSEIKDKELRLQRRKELQKIKQEWLNGDA